MRRWIAILLALVLGLGTTARGAEEKYVALTFDDGPSGRFTRHLLAGLEERQAVATFFLCGYRLEQYPDLAGEILDKGHEIGHHGYSHDAMNAMSRSSLERELTRTEEILLEQTGEAPRLLRPPGGCCNDLVRELARNHGLALVTWSVDPRDWATGNRDAIVRSVVENAGDGDIILLHDMSDSSVDAALEIVDRLQSQGFRFVTVSQLAALRGDALQAGCLYTAFPP